MFKRTVADVLTQALIDAGVERIYGIVGDSLNALTDALRRSGKMRWVQVRHEEVAAFAAGADAQLTGRLAVCAGSCGPGNLHLINGLYDCHRNRVPVLAIAAHIPSSEIGSGYFQETHPERLFQECSHYCELISNPNQMPRSLQMAMQHAVSRGGVAVIVLPGDIALKAAEPTMFGHKVCAAQPVVTPSAAELAALAEMLNRARRVTLLCGSGCAGAHAELMQLCERLQAPMVHALRGKEHVEYDNPYDVGMTGLIGFSSGYQAMMDCDALLMLGTDFPYTQFYPAEAKVAQVDIRPENLGRRCKLELGLCGDVGATIKALLPRLEAHADDAHLARCLAHYREARKGLDDLATGVPGRKPIHPQYLAKVLNEVAGDDAIFTCDVGTPTLWAARYLSMNGRRRLLGSFVHGTMANALPQAIGAQIAAPGRQVIALSGDGGLAMLMGDLLSLRQNRLPVKIVVFNNSALGFVEMEMKAGGYLETGTRLDNPDFAAMAQAIGMLGIRVEDPGEVRPALDQALRHAGPAIVNVATNRMELAMPPKTTAEQAYGFSVWMIKAVLNGRGDEVIELAKTNILR